MVTLVRTVVNIFIINCNIEDMVMLSSSHAISPADNDQFANTFGEHIFFGMPRICLHICHQFNQFEKGSGQLKGGSSYQFLFIMMAIYYLLNPRQHVLNTSC